MMASISLTIMSLLAALFVSLAIASPIEHVASANIDTTSTPMIEAGNSVTNDWMNWYQTCRSCSLDPVRVVSWTNNVCQPVPESDKDSSLYLTSDNTQWIQPSAGYNTRCWTNTGPDCKGKWSKEFDAEGVYTGQLFGKHCKVYQSFMCTCDDKCVVATDVAAREVVEDLAAGPAARAI
ncbi:hypothetical protein Q7P35_008003 [Cladosporium inversicolor]